MPMMQTVFHAQEGSIALAAWSHRLRVGTWPTSLHVGDLHDYERLFQGIMDFHPMSTQVFIDGSPVKEFVVGLDVMGHPLVLLVRECFDVIRPRLISRDPSDL